MPGKRPRQIQRTTSMSLLGGADGGCFTMGARFSRTAPESFLQDAGPSFPEEAASLHRELSPPPREELLDHMEICTEATDAIMEGTLNMSTDGSIEESLLASHAAQLDTLYPAHQPLCLGQTYPAQLAGVHQGTHSSYMSSPAHSKSMAFFRGHGALGSAQPVHFLDVCFLCAKRLGHGRDVFIYRGDRAFCSVECRQSQIMADERREKCGRTSVKERVGMNTPANDAPSSTGQVETAAAA